jgi:glucokinase-like ROK family protein
MLELNPQAGCMVSCELGVDFISVICANFGAETICRSREDTRRYSSQQAIIERMLALVREAVGTGAKLFPGGEHLLGIALGVPGLVDQAHGTLLFAPNLNWKDVPLRTMLSEAFGGVPIFVDNEANLAALGEHLFGAAKGYHEVLFISAGVGLGGAIVRNGELVRGAAGFAGEFGHMTIEPDGELCNCGNRGCWEVRVSQSAIFRDIRDTIARGRTSWLARRDLEQLTIPLVVEAARRGDSLALDVLDQAGHRLGIGIASLVNAFNPDLVVFGGMLSLASEFLLPVIEAELRQRALHWNVTATRIVQAQHGSDACIMGGVATICQAILLQPGQYNAQKFAHVAKVGFTKGGT